ncbi:hypothetical protein QUA56_01650 [Microcoleus sp. N3A4]|uniref:hypothetical protein n=1 Tax=Microcoleus sp. N3A4 TaxID=3055379 RepID=UPI002FD4D150
MIIVSQGAARRSPLSTLGCKCLEPKVAQISESTACDVARTQTRCAAALKVLRS